MTESDQQQLGTTLWNIADRPRRATRADDLRDGVPSCLLLRGPRAALASTVPAPRSPS